ncbi:MAG: DNA polymerase III subunit beta [bacterium]|nr:DNA polymerase III subunit beta [bacterium]
MKLSFLSENIQKKLSFVSHAVSPRSQLSILQNFLIEAKDGEIRISATDLEIGIQITIPAKVENEGVVTIPAKIFTDLINSLPSEKISLELKENTLEVKSGKTRSLFQTSPANDFPKLYETKGEKTAVFKSSLIKENFPSVIFSASSDLGRPALSGVLIKQEKEEFILVATDGFRLSLRRHKNAEKGLKKEKPILIPSRLLRELVAMAGDDEEIEFCISEESNQVLFSKEGVVLIGRLIDAEFPNYQKIIPTEVNTTAVFDKEEMQKAIKICSIFARETANIIKVSLKKEKIIISANTPSIGQNNVEIEVKLTGEENEIAFNSQFLLDLFANTNAESMVFEMTGPLNPGVFKIAEDNSFLHLIMPIRVQG